jgi:hypothetical protein
MTSISRPKKITVSVAAAAAMGVVALSPGAAHADALYTFRLSPASNPFLFVEVAGASTASLATVDQWPYNGGSNQVWVFNSVSGGYQVMNAKSGKCLWTDGRAGDQLRQAPCDGNQWEVWASSSSDGNITSSFHNPASGLYMDVYGSSSAQGGSIDGWPQNGGNNQKFILNPA